MDMGNEGGRTLDEKSMGTAIAMEHGAMDEKIVVGKGYDWHASQPIAVGNANRQIPFPIIFFGQQSSIVPR